MDPAEMSNEEIEKWTTIIAKRDFLKLPQFLTSSVTNRWKRRLGCWSDFGSAPDFSETPHKNRHLRKPRILEVLWRNTKNSCLVPVKERQQLSKRWALRFRNSSMVRLQ